ncbi:MAG: hypothetical protein B1H04_04500 [Planctomycetales bacterium 4484_123]|nr:MAG: hypothetical protein B1H04_04500 [Planctomycetales bacterium 4484_123]
MFEASGEEAIPMRGATGASLRPVLETLEPRVLLSGDLYISEFMAVNDSALMDQDCQYSDWIEIINAGQTTADLTGWYLTDDPAVPDKWAFPSVQLPVGRMLTVFASGKDRADPGGELHTNFRLSANGEYLALVRPDGLTVEHEYAPQYPPQLPDVSYGLCTQWSERALTLVPEQSGVRAWVPTDGSLGMSWTAVDFDDSAWLAGPQAVGYETQSDYDPLIGTDVEGQMYGLNASVYVRLAFEITDPSQLYDDVLTLRMKYDDGFVAYLNGVEVARRNAPETPQWNSAATSWHMDEEAVVFEDIDISQFADLLQVGGNVLAIHGLNYGAGSLDMLIAAELVEVGAVVAVQPGAERYFTTPTPGQANAEGILGLVGDTSFSVDRGFYSEPFDVAITCPTAGAEIRYTLDGTEPTATHGFVYTAPIHIDTTSVLRAAAFKPGYAPSDVDTQTYIFIDDVLSQTRPEGYPTSWSGFPGDYEMDPQIVQDDDYADILDDALLSIPTISIVTDPANLFDSTSGIYTHPTESGVAWERPVSVEWIDPACGQEFQIDCGLRIQGGASREPRYAPKHSFRLLFKSAYGASKLRYPLFGDEATDRFDTIVLRAGFNHSWIAPSVWPSGSRERAQYIRDQWAKDTQRAMGGLGPHNNYAHLYINGLYWGLYNPTERPDAAFAAAYLGGQKEEYDALNSGEIVDGDDSAWGRMFSIANAGVAGQAGYEKLAKLLDIDAFIDYMILNQYMGNTDWDWHNWYAFRRRTADGKFYFVNWDSEWIFMDVDENRLGVDRNYAPTRLFNKLIENPEFRLRFADHVHRHFFNDGVLTPQAVVQRWNGLSEQVHDAVVAESARWGDYRRDVDPRGEPQPIPLYERDVHWLAERERLLNEYFPYRTDAVLNQYIAAGLYPSVAAPEFNRQGGSVPEGFELSIQAPEGTIYYRLDGADPRLPDGSVAPEAVVYDGPVALTEPVHAVARAKSGDTWSALNEARFAIAGSPVRIGELMYNPAPADGPVRVIDENFDDGSADGFEAGRGTWTVTGGRYHAQPISTYDYSALATAGLESYLPEDFRLAVTMNTTTSHAWGFVVFDFQDLQDFKFAGAAQDEGRWVIGHRDGTGWSLDAVAPAAIAPGQDYRLEVVVLDDAVSLWVDGQAKVAWNFGDATCWPSAADTTPPA